MKRMLQSKFEDFISSLRTTQIEKCIEELNQMSIVKKLLDDNMLLEESIGVSLSNILCCHMQQSTSNVKTKTEIDMLLGQLSQTETKELCGYTFKTGDIAFNCRTCQADDTCVQCMKCFENSYHEGHEVYFHRTTPGGMCDCGDAEAWDPNGFCKHHGKKKNDPAGIICLPASLDQIGQILIQQVLKFLVETIQASHSSFNPDDVTNMTSTIPSDEKCLYVRLFNDDVHLDVKLIALLASTGLINAAQSTKEIHNNGIGYVLSKCKVYEAMKMFRSLVSEGYLVSVVTSNQIRDEKICMRLVEWLLDLCNYSKGLEKMIASGLILLDAKPQKCVLAELITKDPYIQKPLALKLHELYMKILGDRDVKMLFAEIYMRQYDVLAMRYLFGIGTDKETIFHFGVQIFTTPSVVKHLVPLGLVEILLDILLRAIQMPKSFDTSKDDIGEDFDLTHSVVKHRRYEFFLRDLDYVLNITSIPNYICRKPELLKQYFLFLAFVQGIHPQRRIPEGSPHIDEERHDWCFAWILHLQMLAQQTLLLKGIKAEDGNYDLEALQNVLDQFVLALNDFADTRKFYIETTENIHPLAAFTGSTSFRVSKDFISLRFPLHHFFSRLLFERLSCIQHNELPIQKFKEMLFHLYPFNSTHGQRIIYNLIEYPLRTLVFISQVESGLWVRNGENTLSVQLRKYSDYSSCLEFRDWDLLLLQFGALEIGFPSFLSLFFERYELKLWFFDTSSNQEYKLPRSKLLQLAEKCLLNLTWIVTEIPPLNINDGLVLRREILHHLAIKPCTQSELLEIIKNIKKHYNTKKPVDDMNYLQSILEEIAIKKENTSTGDINPSTYTLKYEYYAEYDPSFYHLSSEDHGNAHSRKNELEIIRYGKACGLSKPFPIVGCLPKGVHEMEPLRLILFEIPVMTLLNQILKDTVNQASKKSSETILTRALHIMTLQQHLLLDVHLHKHVKGDENLIKNYFNLCRGHIEKNHSTVSDHDDTTIPSSPLLIESDSILVLLTEMVKQDPAPPPSLASSISWLLHQFSTLDVYCKRYIEKSHIFHETDITSKLLQRKEAQKRAMEAMVKQQAAFAGTFNDEEEKEEDLSSEQNEILPECSICYQITDSPIVYVGIVQRSTALKHAFGEDWKEPLQHATRSGALMHIQLCGHAMHLDCYKSYLLKLESHIARDREYQVRLGINIAMKEFMCPVCQRVSNCLIPYIPKEYRPNPSNLEDVFRSFKDYDSISTWTNHSLPLIFKKDPEIPKNAVFDHPLKDFASTLVGIGAVNPKNELLAKFQRMDGNSFENVHVLWSSIANTIRCHEQALISKYFISMQHQYYKDQCKVSFMHRLGNNPKENNLDLMSANDERTLNCLLVAINQFHVFYDSSQHVKHAIYDPLQLMLVERKEKVMTWQQAVDATAPLTLCQSLLSCDLFYVVILLSCCFKDKKDIVMAMRLLCCVHSVQVLLKSIDVDMNDESYSNDYSEKEMTSETYEINEEVKAVMNLQKRFLSIMNASLPETSFKECQLLYLYQSSCASFLRQVILFCRILLRGTDEEFSQYAVFVNSLEVSMDYFHMADQLGIPTPSQLIQSSSLLELLDEYVLQFKQSSQNEIPQSVRVDYMEGNLSSLKRRAEALGPTNEITQTSINLEWMNYIPSYAVPIRIYHLHQQQLYWFAHAGFTTLPYLYTDLHSQMGHVLCPTSGKVMNNPAICLVCGQVLCAGSNCCREENGIGPCTQHARECSSGCCIFFILRRCKTLVIWGYRSAFSISPYVDALGEEDEDLRRGRPLFLNMKRFQALFTYYIQYQIANEIAANRRNSSSFIISNFY